MGQENIETVHKPEPTQAADILWGQGRRAMKDPYGPQTRVGEGACAIKVSMSCFNVRAGLLYDLLAHGPGVILARNSQPFFLERLLYLLYMRERDSVVDFLMHLTTPKICGAARLA